MAARKKPAVKEEQIDRLNELAQAEDVAHTRKLQYLESIQDPELEKMFRSSPSKPFWHTLAVAGIQLGITLLTTCVISYFVSSKTYYDDKLKMSNDITTIREEVHSLRKSQDSFETLRKDVQDLKTEVYGARGTVKEDIKGLKQSVSEIDKRLWILEKTNGTQPTQPAK